MGRTKLGHVKYHNPRCIVSSVSLPAGGGGVSYFLVFILPSSCPHSWHGVMGVMWVSCNSNVMNRSTLLQVSMSGCCFLPCLQSGIMCIQDQNNSASANRDGIWNKSELWWTLPVSQCLLLLPGQCTLVVFRLKKSSKWSYLCLQSWTERKQAKGASFNVWLLLTNAWKLLIRKLWILSERYQVMYLRMYWYPVMYLCMYWFVHICLAYVLSSSKPETNFSSHLFLKL